MKRFSSFGARLIACTLATAAITFATLVGVVVLRMNQSLKEQSLEVSRWSEQSLAQRLVGDARLARSHLMTLREDVARRFSTLARRSDIARAIESRNTVAIVEVLEPALRLADIDGVLIVDADSRVIGADRMNADILRANGLLAASVLGKPTAAVLRGNDAQVPRNYRSPVRLDETLAAALAIDRRSSALADVFIEPVFDEFGETIAAVIGYREVRSSEPSLVDFAQLSGRSVLVLSGGQQVSSAGTDLDGVEIWERPRNGFIRIDDGRYVAQCAKVDDMSEICALAPAAELQHLSEQLIGIGQEQTGILIAWLVIGAAASMLLFATVSAIVSRHIVQPLVAITAVVGEVARGNWRTRVPGVNRADEVGDIARAVVVLEDKMAERDRLRAETAIQNGVLVQREEQLAEQNVRFDAALNNMSQGLCMFDAKGHLTVWNDRFVSIYRLGPSDLTHGGSLRSTLKAVVAASGMPAEAIEPMLAEQIQVAATRRAVHFTRTLLDGRTIAVAHQPMEQGGWVETHEDVTQKRAAEARIVHLARHDPLTDLPNRLLFGERLADAYRATTHGTSQFAVLCLDLDDFKGVNDTYGHAGGDELLKAVSQRIVRCVGTDDTVARLGGDEFAIIHRHQDHPEAAIDLARRLLEALRLPYLIQGQSVMSGASIGIAFGSERVGDDERLLSNADLALYTAKKEGRGTYRTFEPQMEERAQGRLRMERDLRIALSRKELAVFYQPLFNLERNEISGFEALVRWNHPERGMISPADFIPLAEEVGLIDELGEFVLREACAEAVNWPAHMKVAVNISPVQFRNKDFAHSVVRAVAASGLPTSRLDLEITESVILHDDPETLATLHQLRSMGIRFSMDDFGTGYSSLSCLRSFPFDKIKLDRSFLKGSLDRDDSAAIIRTVADLGASLNMSTTGEGVETVEQLRRLRENGFVEAQGFLFSPAVPAHDVRRVIRESLQLRQVA